MRGSPSPPFWRSVNLTGNQTTRVTKQDGIEFWRSVNLTGNQTYSSSDLPMLPFWRSVNLTGNQTTRETSHTLSGFGAVSI